MRTMISLADRVMNLHHPSLNRVTVPGIILDKPACNECGHAWPCPTYELAQGETHD